MNIDLLFTAKGEAGLISSEILIKKAAGIVLDTQTGTLTIEFADMDYLELNIPVDSTFFRDLDQCPHLHIGAIQNAAISQAYQAPLMFQDDPYRSELFSDMTPVETPLIAFNRFITLCKKGQPVHRIHLGDESAMGCILGDATPASLTFAPHLARRHTMETTPPKPPHIPTPRGPENSR